jgi:hypothetical protein
MPTQKRIHELHEQLNSTFEAGQWSVASGYWRRSAWVDTKRAT